MLHGNTQSPLSFEKAVAEVAIAANGIKIVDASNQPDDDDVFYGFISLATASAFDSLNAPNIENESLLYSLTFEPGHGLVCYPMTHMNVTAGTFALILRKPVRDNHWQL